ncbi:MAG TPA: NAD(+) diphosphatase [Gammaproteobacteria bacterium]|nr:NAD(+) diphosphatase [Gammaproteobacteria bacterium]
MAIDTPNIFAGGAFDRLAERRKDVAWLEAALASDRARFLVAWDHLSPTIWQDDQPVAAWLDAGAVANWRAAAREIVLLGEANGDALFGLMFDAPPAADLPFTPVDLRQTGPLLEAGEANLLAWFRALVHWHRTHRFCPRCGGPTVAAAAGHERYCEACEAHHFPRVDPAIIVLVEDDDRCLLGTQSVDPGRRYSTLAGFVEPGESLEDTVRREVFEEAGVVVGETHYRSSQPWPFPASLMLGFTATATRTDIRLRDGELRDARWFTRADIDAGVASGEFRLPSELSIAYRLIRDWYERDGKPLTSTQQSRHSRASGSP